MPNLEHCDKETLVLVNLQRQLGLQHHTPCTPPGSHPGAPPARLQPLRLRSQPQGKAPFTRGWLTAGGEQALSSEERDTEREGPTGRQGGRACPGLSGPTGLAPSLRHHYFLSSLGRHRDNAPPHRWPDELETLVCDQGFIKALVPASPS